MVLREPCNRKNEWKFKFTFYGFCLEFNNDTDADILKKISVGRQTSLRNDTLSKLMVLETVIRKNDII